MDGLKIETIKGSDGNEISVCPSRGGIITSLKFKGTEILYLDESTFLDKNVNVRGGVPILFPNAGPIESEKFPGLKQHGFARNSSVWTFERDADGRGFRETLVSNEEIKAVYSFDFKLTVRGVFEDDGSFSLFEEVLNTETEKDIPISMGLHPYFKILDNKKKEIIFDFDGGEIIKTWEDKWMNGTMVSVNNPGNPIKITIPDLGIILMNVSSEYKKIWAWSLPEKDFVCIEPIMRDPGGLAENPEIIKPGSLFSARVNFKLEKLS